MGSTDKDARHTSLNYSRYVCVGRKGRKLLWIIVVAVVVASGTIVVLLLPDPDTEHRRRLAEVWSGSRLHQIGLAISLYCADHGGDYPDSLAGLAIAERISPENLVAPLSSDTPAALPAGSVTVQQLAAALAVPGHLSYVYRGRGWVAGRVPADAVVAYTRPGCFADGSDILFGDGHVDWLPAVTAARLIASASATTQPVSSGYPVAP